MLAKMLETCSSMTFPNFQREMEWCQSILQKCPWKPIQEIYGYCSTHGHLMFSKFRTLCQVNNSMQFYVQNLFGQIWPPIPCMWSLPTLWLDMKKRSTTCTTFSTHKQKSSVKSPFYGGTVHKISMRCMYRCTDKFCCESDWQWT